MEQTEDAANRPRHERRSSREDLDVRRSNDSASRQPSSDYQGPARKPVGGPGGEISYFIKSCSFYTERHPFMCFEMDVMILLGFLAIGFSLSVKLCSANFMFFQLECREITLSTWRVVTHFLWIGYQR